MSDTRAAMREFRFLDEKRKLGSLSPVEEARWVELRGLLGIQDTAPVSDASAWQQQAAPQGYYAADGQWYPYPAQGYAQQQPQGYYAADGQWYAYPTQDYAQQPQGYYGEDGQWYAYPAQGYDPNQGYAQPGYDPNQGYAAQGYDPNQGYAQPGYDPNQGYAGYPQQGGYDPNAQAYDPNAQAYDPNAQQAYDPNAQQAYAGWQGDANAQQAYDPNAQQAWQQGYAQPQAYAGYAPQAPAEQDPLSLNADDIDIPALSEPAPWMPPAAAPAPEQETLEAQSQPATEEASAPAEDVLEVMEGDVATEDTASDPSASFADVSADLMGADGQAPSTEPLPEAPSDFSSEMDFSSVSEPEQAPVHAAAETEPSLESSFADMSLEVESAPDAPAETPAVEAAQSTEEVEFASSELEVASSEVELVDATAESEPLLAEDQTSAPMDDAWASAPLAVESAQSETADAGDIIDVAAQDTGAAGAEDVGSDFESMEAEPVAMEAAPAGSEIALDASDMSETAAPDEATPSAEASAWDSGEQVGELSASEFESAEPNETAQAAVETETSSAEYASASESAPAEVALDASDMAEAQSPSEVALDASEAAPAEVALDASEVSEAQPDSAEIALDASDVSEVQPDSEIALEASDVSEAASAEIALDASEVSEAAPAEIALDASDVSEATPYADSGIADAQESATAAPETGATWEQAPSEEIALEASDVSQESSAMALEATGSEESVPTLELDATEATDFATAETPASAHDTAPMQAVAAEEPSLDVLDVESAPESVEPPTFEVAELGTEAEPAAFASAPVASPFVDSDVPSIELRAVQVGPDLHADTLSVAGDPAPAASREYVGTPSAQEMFDLNGSPEEAVPLAAAGEFVEYRSFIPAGERGLELGSAEHAPVADWSTDSTEAVPLMSEEQTPSADWSGDPADAVPLATNADFVSEMGTTGEPWTPTASNAQQAEWSASTEDSAAIELQPEWASASEPSAMTGDTAATELQPEWVTSEETPASETSASEWSATETEASAPATRPIADTAQFAWTAPKAAQPEWATPETETAQAASD
ncbi:hypothetical protein ACLESD_43675, partial [Pyxidicoccus sp. 3LFB2]